jgi:hypothetical protein
MKVLDLCCSSGHGFEGWFASDDDYQAQNGRGLVECPLCADRVVRRLPSAPRLNLSAARGRDEPAPKASTTAVAAPGPVAPADPARQLHAAWLQAVRHVIANTEDVGTRFAEEARRIHYGETEPRAIRGEATADDAQALAEEGIEVAVLPVPPALKEPLQ